MKTANILVIIFLSVLILGCNLLPIRSRNLKQNFVGDTFTDSRDGQTYKVVKIGNQVWMAENLNYETSTGSWCYDDDTENCDKYGRLYDWKTARKACPKGWHLPTDAEFRRLISFLGGNKAASIKLKAPTRWDDPSNKNLNSSGFTARLGGLKYRGANKYFLLESSGIWWSASKSRHGGVHGIALNFRCGNITTLTNRNNLIVEEGYSVRCMRY
jgi:uncharacterized protein (TIGR02145 family)